MPVVTPGGGSALGLDWRPEALSMSRFLVTDPAEWSQDVV